MPSTLSSCPIPPTPAPDNTFTTPHATACPDTAATGHFIPPGCSGKQLPHQPMDAICANQTSVTSIATLELDVPNLTPAMKKATVFEEIKRPLFSTPVVADEDCEVIFRKKDMEVLDKNKKVILRGTRDPLSKLWLVPIGQPKISHMQQLLAQRDNQTVPDHCVNSAHHQKNTSKINGLPPRMCGLHPTSHMDQSHQQ